jgi:hypothetical protein
MPVAAAAFAGAVPELNFSTSEKASLVAACADFN